MSDITPDLLLAIDEAVANQAWGAFLFNQSAAVQVLKTTPPEQLQQVLVAGGNWGGAGWNTTKAAKKVKELTGVAMVTTNFKEYLHSFLYSLALAAGVEVEALDLTEKSAEVAFSLSELWTHETGQDAPVQPAGVKDGQEEDSEDDTLPWETPLVPLEPELNRCLRRLQAGERLPLKTLLEELPLFEGLKHKAEENNHGQDGKSTQDSLLKAGNKECYT